MKYFITGRACSWAAFIQSILNSHRFRLIMRVSILNVLLLTGSLKVLMATTVNGQELDKIRIEIELNHEELPAAFKKIEIQTGLLFAYPNTRINEYPRVTLAKGTYSVKEVLDKSLEGTPFQYWKKDNHVIIFVGEPENTQAPPNNNYEFVNQFAVSGKISEATSHDPLPGVNITVKGKTVGTTSDAEGRFSIDVSETDVLVFSFIGFKTFETAVAGRSLIDVALEIDVQTLQEVEVVGTSYWSTSKVNSTSSTVKITAKDIETQPITSPLLALQGRVAGLDLSPNTGLAGNAPQIRIRGNNSLRDNGSLPLVIIDGVPINSGQINTQNPLMTGGFDPLSTINPANIESVEVLKDGDATAIYGSRGANGVIIIKTKKGTPRSGTNMDITFYSGVGKISRKIDLLNREQYLTMRREAFRNDGLKPDINYDDDLLTWDTTRTTDWQKELLGGMSRITDVQGSVSGGSGNTSFQFGGGYHKESMIFPGDFGYRRVNGKLNLNHSSSNKKFNASIVINFGRDNNRIPNNFDYLSQALTLPPDAPSLFDAKGNLNFQPRANGTSSWLNPLASLKNIGKSNFSNLSSNAVLSYELAPGLTAKTNMGYTEINQNEVALSTIESQQPELRASSFGTSRFAQNRRYSWIIEPQIQYYRTIKDHKLETFLGTTLQELTAANSTTEASGYTTDARLEDISGATSYAITNSNSQYRYDAIYLRCAYNFKSTYILNLTGRRDGSSRFGPGKRFGNFGSVGVAWNFSNLKYFRDHRTPLTTGKIRSSFAITGNDQIGDYKYYNVYQSAPLNYQSGSSISPGSLFNPNYAWEETRKIEAAIELGFVENKLSLEINYYNNTTSNQLIDYSLPATTGFPSITKNFNAIIKNYGWEFMLSTVNIEKRNIRWTSSINVSLPKNVLYKLDDIRNSPYAYVYQVGEPLSIRSLYIFTGINPETGKTTFQDINNDGIIDYQDRRVMLPLNKKFYGGVTNSFHFKGFDLSFLIQFISQHATKYMPTLPGRKSNQPLEVFNRWTNSGDLSTYPKFTQDVNANYTDYTRLQTSAFNYADASFVRLKTVTLSYALATQRARRMNLNTLRVYVQGQNLYTFTKYKNLDPETGSGVPPLRIITCGIQVSI